MRRIRDKNRKYNILVEIEAKFILASDRKKDLIQFFLPPFRFITKNMEVFKPL